MRALSQGGDSIIPLGYIPPLLKLIHKVVRDVHLLVVDILSPFNAILGIPPLNKLWAIISTAHLAIKLPGPGVQV